MSATAYQVHGEVAVITLSNPPVNGLGHALRSLITDPVLQLAAGQVALPGGPGLGTEPDLAALAPYLALRTDRAA